VRCSCRAPHVAPVTLASYTAPQDLEGELPLEGRLFSAVLNGLDNLIDRGRLDEHIVEASAVLAISRICLP